MCFLNKFPWTKKSQIDENNFINYFFFFFPLRHVSRNSIYIQIVYRIYDNVKNISQHHSRYWHWTKIILQTWMRFQPCRIWPISRASQSPIIHVFRWLDQIPCKKFFILWFFCVQDVSISHFLLDIISTDSLVCKDSMLLTR